MNDQTPRRIDSWTGLSGGSDDACDLIVNCLLPHFMNTTTFAAREMGYLDSAALVSGLLEGLFEFLLGAQPT